MYKASQLCMDLIYSYILPSTLEGKLLKCLKQSALYCGYL